MLDCLADLWVKLLAAWLLATEVVGFFIMWVNKARAVHGEWRVPEGTFFLLAFLGGFWGILAAEPIFHHKTLKLRFTIVVLAAGAIWLFALSRVAFFSCLFSLV